ncbi:RDD family protein [Kitasatospora sp. GAS1066B]|uniref:RDD family protein n=1 Tax=Kitasatospora sp. GAS1066B TaxID=3156271 RepID=UPI0035134A06
MSSYDPSSPEPEGGGKPSFDKQPPKSDPPQDSPPPANGSPYDGSPYGGGGGYGGGGPYGGDGPYGGGGPYGGSPSGAPVGGPAPIAGMPPLGTWPHRILARLIDYLLIQVLAFVVVLPFTGFTNRNGWTDGVWVYYVLYFVYDGVMISRDGQTLGKKAMKVRAAMLSDGSSPTSSAAWTRAAVYTLPAVICCGLWWIVDGMFGVFDKPYRQCVHDKAAKTVVVSTN